MTPITVKFTNEHASLIWFLIVLLFIFPCFKVNIKLNKEAINVLLIFFGAVIAIWLISILFYCLSLRV